MGSETKFGRNALNALNKERIIWKAPKIVFQNINMSSRI